MISIAQKRRNKEKIAKAILWIAAGITMATLFVIIGYILFRGFVSDRRIEYDVIGSGEAVIAAENSEQEDIVVLINSGIRIDELTMEDVIELFNGKRKDWGRISEQDLDVRLFALKEGALRESFDQLVLGKEEKYSRKIAFLDTEEEVIKNVASTPGAIGYISAQKASEIKNKNIKIPKVRRISIVVNPAVLETQNNRRLQYLTEEDVQAIFSGAVSNWSQLGGIDLPIKLISYEPKTRIAREFNKLVMEDEVQFSDDAIIVGSLEEMGDALKSHPGAVAYCYYLDALEQEYQIVKIERQEIEPNFTLNFLLEEPKQAGQVGGVSTIILNTIYMVLLTLLFSIPIGVGAAVFFTEYAKEGKLIRILRFGTETLAGIPSIIFGLFGFIFFTNYLKMGVGLLSGSMTLTIMILPTIIRTSEEALRTVPRSYREGSLALGATKWQTIRKVVIPAAIPGILTGVILGMGRAIGETAALLFTMGTDYRLADSLSSSARTLSVHLYILVKEGISFERAFATGTLLIILILIINSTANYFIGRMNKLKG